MKTSSVRADDLLSQLSSEDPQDAEQQLEVNTNNPTLEWLVDKMDLEVKLSLNDPYDYYELTYGLIEHYNQTIKASDIAQLALVANRWDKIDDFENPLGYFLSACINKCRDDKIIIPTSHLEYQVNYLGFGLDGKEIIVSGNVGHNFCNEMTTGRVLLKGNADEYLGHHMSGGYLEVQGNAGNWTA